MDLKSFALGFYSSLFCLWYIRRGRRTEIHLFPDGKVFYSGSDPQSQLFDPNASINDPLQWIPRAVSRCERVHGISVLLPLELDASGAIRNNAGVKVLIAGGRNVYPGVPTQCPTGVNGFTIESTADIYTQTTDQWNATGSMTKQRDMHQAVILPDGKVVVVGGEDKMCSDIVNDCPGTQACEPVYEGDLFNPLTGTWTQIPPPPIDQQRPRQYHSGAILLPDGSVLIVGGETDAHDTCWPGDNRHKTAQIYKPGYFFRPGTNARPTFDSQNPFPNPNGIQMIYGQTFTINAPNANLIAKVVLIRTSSVTHSFNSDQRYLELNIASRTASSLVVNAPANPNIAPLGYYMMFLVKETTPGDINTRIPSEAKFVRLVTTPSQSSPSRR